MMCLQRNIPAVSDLAVKSRQHMVVTCVLFLTLDSKPTV